MAYFNTNLIRMKLCKCGKPVRKGKVTVRYKVGGIVKHIYKYPHNQCPILYEQMPNITEKSKQRTNTTMTTDPEQWEKGAIYLILAFVACVGCAYVLFKLMEN